MYLSHTALHLSQVVLLPPLQETGWWKQCLSGGFKIEDRKFTEEKKHDKDLKAYYLVYLGVLELFITSVCTLLPQQQFSYIGNWVIWVSQQRADI